MEMGDYYKMKKNKKVNKIISKIESTRSKNNINWMDILRIAMKHSPKETQKALKKINNQDQKISKLLRKIT